MIALADNMNRIRETAAEAWQPREFPATPEWCEQNVVLPPDTEATPGPFDLDRRPYWREPLAMLDDPVVETITIKKATQLGGTVSLLAAALSRSVIAPAPGMVVTPDRDSSHEMRDRLYGIALETPATRGQVPPERLWNQRHVDLGTMRIYLAYSGSRQRMRGRPCKYVWMTEVDVYKRDKKAGAAIRAGRERVKAFYRSLILFESSPTDDDSEIAGLYDLSDQRKWNVKCPHCGRYQPLRFFCYAVGDHAGRGGIGSLKDAAGNWRDPEKARRDAHYVCLSGCRIDQQDKEAMMTSGVWVPKGRAVDQNGRLVGRPARSKRNVGYELSSIVSDQVSFADMAAAYFEHRETGELPAFWNNWLGLKYTTRRPLPTWKELGRRLAYTHHRGTVPKDVWFLTGGADVQEDRVYFAVRGWGDRRTSWQIDWGVLDRHPEQEAEGLCSDLAQLNAVLSRRYEVIDGRNPLGKTRLRVRLLGVDANYRTADVHDWVRSHGKTDRLRTVRGDHKIDPRKEKFRRTLVERNVRTGQAYEGGMELWGIFVSSYKAWLIDRFSFGRGKPGSWHLCADVIDQGADYLRQLVNEPKSVDVGPDGRTRFVFKPRSKTIGVDYWDCEVYAAALADMVVGSMGWKASDWPRPKQDARRSSARARGKVPAVGREFGDV